jgi:hypothetical protein
LIDFSDKVKVKISRRRDIDERVEFDAIEGISPSFLPKSSLRSVKQVRNDHVTPAFHALIVRTHALRG